MYYVDRGNVRHYRERFSQDDVEDSFMHLLEKLECLWSEVNVSKLISVCSRDIRISAELSARLRSITALDELFDLLSKTPFFSWLEITILKRMARVAEVSEATKLIMLFEECVHHKKCSEVDLYLKKQYINPSHLTCVIAKYNRNSENLIVADLINYCRKLETLSGLQAESSALIKYEKGCLKVCYVIPMHCRSRAYKIARKNFFKLRLIHLQYLKIEEFSKIYAVNTTEKETIKCLLEIRSSILHCELYTYVYNTYVATVIELFHVCSCKSF